MSSTCDCGGPDVELIKRGVIRIATHEGEGMTPPKTAKEVIEQWMFTEGSWKQTMLNGRVVISTSEANGSVSFAVPEGWGKGQVFAMLEAILEELENSHRPIKRLRFTYNTSFL